MNMMCTAPRLSPTSSSLTPTAKSLTPSPSKSPMFATVPNKSESDNVGPFAVESLISTVDFTSPFAAYASDGT